MAQDEGQFMHALARRLFPITRSITGNGVRETLGILQEHLPGMTIHEVPSGTEVFDWIVPDEWNIRSATLTAPDGTVVANLADSNLHVVGYSVPVDRHVAWDELQGHLHSLPDQPDAIPYVTSYYNRTWGFCVTDEVRNTLPEGTYHARIDSTLEPGSLTYGELVLPGESDDEVFVSTYVCHPSLANNELSGPMVTAAFAMWFAAQPRRHYTYRFVFVPETIGAIAYTARHLHTLKARVVAGFVLTCIGDDRAYTYLASREGNARIDRIARRALHSRPNPREYSYLMRGSDERQYCAPGIDLPVVSLMRSKYADYPEYHTSLDDLERVVTPTGLQGGLDFVRECIEELETDLVFTATHLGEPQLGRRGLYHLTTGKTVEDEILLRTHVLAYADGQHSVKDMSEVFGVPESTLTEMVELLAEHDLITPHHQRSRPRSGAED